MESVRLQKFFTDCGVLSRRAAEEEIRKGLVKVNGEVADIGCKIDPEQDTVEYNGRIIKPTDLQKHYILLYKPRGIVTTLSDEKGRTTVADLVAGVGARVYPVGRLDMDSDGLLLLTDDGALTERLTHPRHEIPKRYHVTVAGVVTPAQLSALNSSFLLDGYTTRPAKVSVVRAESGETVLAFELYEGRNRQIRRMCDQVALRVKRLTRVAIGRIGIGDLVAGQYRALTEEEIAYLRGEDQKTTKPAKVTKPTRTAKPQKAEKTEETAPLEQKPATKKKAATEKKPVAEKKPAMEKRTAAEIKAAAKKSLSTATAKATATTKKVLEALNVSKVIKEIKAKESKAARSAKTSQTAAPHKTAETPKKRTRRATSKEDTKE